MRTNQRQIDAALREFTDLLSSEVGRPVAVTLHRGNGSYKIANVLIVDGTNVWAEAKAGCTTGEAYRGLRTLIAGIALVSDIRESDRLRDLRAVPDWNTEVDGGLSLSDCKHYDTPGPDCSGPRVGITRDGVILCEGCYNHR